MRMTFDIAPERREEIIRLLRRAAIIVLPGIGLFVFAGFVFWMVRRQLDALAEGLVVEPEADEIPEAPTEIAPV